MLITLSKYHQAINLTVYVVKEKVIVMKLNDDEENDSLMIVVLQLGTRMIRFRKM